MLETLRLLLVMNFFDMLYSVCLKLREMLVMVV